MLVKRVTRWRLLTDCGPNMAYKIVETQLAGQDLDSILEYIALSLANPSAAAAFADKVEKCYLGLQSMPMMYELCRDKHLRAFGYRKVSIGNHIMIYKINELDKTVVIMRFFYGRQDYKRLLDLF